ncbi:MAG TPA: hypothetical protein VFA09_23965 [Ktedonobacteraceae bacterium]|nr:hypothetical protein [Ktedonobacteraceae bacterium]
MKAAALALAFLLLVGAAVILAFANTLSSWVLGGLIGGLAALLISIPISLALFTIMARRHDEHFFMQQEEEEMVYDDDGEYAEVYEADAYVLPSEEDQYVEPRRRLPEARNVSAQDYPRLPAAGQSHARAAANGMYNQRALRSPQGTQHPSQALPAQQNSARMPAQRPALTGSLPYLGNQASSLAKHRTAALRAARIEAARDLYNESDDLPTTTSMSRRLPGYPSQSLKVQSDAEGLPRPTRRLPQQDNLSRRPRHSMDTNTTRQTGARRYRQVDSARSLDSNPQTGSLEMQETNTDKLHGRFEQTEPLRRNPETGKFARNPQLEEQPRNPDVVTGSLKNPLLRRAPYMYEDDPLREQLAQYIERPITRRSSLQEPIDEE